MKRIMQMLGTLTMILLATSLINAQVSIGIRGGVNLARAHWADEDEVDTDAVKFQTGVYVAIPVEIVIDDFFAIQPELAFMQKGIRTYYEWQSQIGGYTNYLTDDYRTIMNFLELPVLGKARFGSEIIRAYAVAGPQVACALDGKHKVERTITNGTSQTIKRENTIKFRDNINRVDFGAVVGIGGEVKAGPGYIVVDARYGIGLQRIYTVEDKIYHRGIGLSLGYKVPRN